MRARIARLLIATLLGGTIVVAPIAPASAAPRPFTRTVEPWIPGQPPTTPPLVNLTAACIRLVAGGQLEAVFGYDNPGTLSASVPFPQDGGVTNGNVIVRDTFRLRPPHQVTTIETEGPQATQFLPGSHPHVFAVRFALNQQVAWQVRVPSSDDPVDRSRLEGHGAAEPAVVVRPQRAEAFRGGSARVDVAWPDEYRGRLRAGDHVLRRRDQFPHRPHSMQCRRGSAPVRRRRRMAGPSQHRAAPGGHVLRARPRQRRCLQDERLHQAAPCPRRHRRDRPGSGRSPT